MPPNLADLGSSLASLVKGRLYGTVYPPKKNPPGLAVDGRTIALRTLARYIAALTFWRPGDTRGSPPIPFTIPIERFFIEMPDDKQSMGFPCITVVHNTAQYKVIGLTPYVEEDSLDQWGPGTVVQWQDEYVEDIQLEVWCNMKAERRAILAGIETALSPTEQQAGLRFHMPDYYDEIVCFMLSTRRLVDNPDSLRKRRSATLGINMRFTVVALVNAVTMQPVMRLGDLGPGVSLSGPGARSVGP